MKRHRVLYQATAALLALILTLEPVAAAVLPADVEEPQEDYIEQVADVAADPMLGVQSGVEDTAEAQGPRTLEELVTLDGVTLTEDGQLTSVKTSLLDSLSEEERSLLLTLRPVTTYTARTADPTEELKEQFGLTDDETEQGARLHGDMLAFTHELSDLCVNYDNMTISEQQMAELVQLIVAGYTCSQAIIAYAAMNTFELDLSDLKAEKQAEIEQLMTTDEEALNKGKEADVKDYLSLKDRAAEIFGGADHCVWKDVGIPN